jgi:hypothetical protein
MTHDISQLILHYTIFNNLRVDRTILTIVNTFSFSARIFFLLKNSQQLEEIMRNTQCAHVARSLLVDLYVSNHLVDNSEFSSKKMNYDDVLPYLSKNNRFGSYQKKIYVLLCLPSVICAFHKLAGVFLLEVPDHRCKLVDELSNESFSLTEDVLRSSIPYDDIKREFSKCQYFDRQTNESLNCVDYKWNANPNEMSAVQSFGLVCDRGTLRASADSIMMFGVLLGSYIFGDLSDRYGRKPIFIISLVIQVIFGLLTSIAPEFITYSICRMVR